MTATILFPVLIVSGVGIVSGVILSIAAIVLQVPVDERQKALRDVLPGANCGACGYAGCDGYAEAMAAGDAEVSKCTPGGADVRNQLADILGVASGEFKRTAAYVRCAGSYTNTQAKMQYAGQFTCASANQLFAGPGSCAYGCTGFGDCVSVCEYDAIHICNGVAVIDPAKCAGCAKCIAACPKSVITMAPAEGTALLACSSHDKGADARKICTAGCIGCTKCVKACPENAISMDNSLAVIDYDKCVGCNKCVSECPQSCIKG